jgi:PhoH-like ATPase
VATNRQAKSPSRTTSGSRARKSKRRTYVLDTSVLLADPGALRRFAEHEVVLPVVVITELEG